jgi:hypothetical protein
MWVLILHMLFSCPLASQPMPSQTANLTIIFFYFPSLFLSNEKIIDSDVEQSQQCSAQKNIRRLIKKGN